MSFKWDDKGAAMEPASTQASTLTDAQNPTLTPLQGVGVQSGIVNGDFREPPLSPTANISNETNPLVGWVLVYGSGTAITAALLANASYASGYALWFAMAAGAAGDDTYVEQVVLLGSSSGGYLVVDAVALMQGPATAAKGTGYVTAQYVKNDGTTTGTAATSTIAAATTAAVAAAANGGLAAPVDAAGLRIRIGYKRDAALTSATGSVFAIDVRTRLSTDKLKLANTTLTTAPAELSSDTAGALVLASMEGGGGQIVVDATTTTITPDKSDVSFGTVVLNGATVSVVRGNLAFPAAAVASADVHTLDDYEEGTFTPTLDFVTTGNLSVAYTIRLGRYQKVGNRVHIWIDLLTSAFTHTTAAGNLQITGLPFTSAAITRIGYMACLMGGYTKAGYQSLLAQVGSSATTLTIAASGSGNAIDTIAVADVLTGSTIAIRIGGTYETA